MTRTVWTTDMESVIRAGVRAGKNAGEVAAELGLTSQAVNAKANRLGLRFAAGRRYVRATGGVIPMTEPAKLGPHTCSWPIGEPQDPGFHFCGQLAVHKKPYCPAHAAKAINPQADPLDTRRVERMIARADRAGSFRRY